jgi:hypothetical protein
VDDVRLQVVEEPTERALRGRIVPGVAEVRIEEVVDEFVDRQTVPGARCHGEVRTTDVLLGREHVDLVSRSLHPRGEFPGVDLRARGVPRQEIVGDEEDPHVVPASAGQRPDGAPPQRECA